MRIWKRAGVYLIRKKYRSILLILLLFVMATFSFAGNSMRTGAVQEIDTIRRNLGSSFVVAADTNNQSLYEERYDQEFSYSIFTGKRIAPKLIDEITSKDGIAGYEIKESMLVWTNIKLKEAAWADAVPMPQMNETELQLRRESTNVIFCGNGETNVNFRTGAFSIVSGRNVLKDDESTIVISENLAEKNGLSIGDSVTLETKKGHYEITNVPFETLGTPVELKIVGFFNINFEQQIDMFTYEEQCAENFLFIDQHSGTILKNNLQELYPGEDTYNEVTFFVDDPENLETVLENVKDQVDLSGLNVSLDDSAYSASIKPLRQIEIFSTVLLAVGTIGCAVILYLVLSLWIKTRIHEIGILLSIGINKRKIIGQMLLECAAVVSLSLIFAIAAAPYATELSFHMAEEATAPKEGQESYTVETEYGNPLPSINKVSSEKVELIHEISWQDYVILIVLTYAVSCLSVLAASVQIIKVPPKTLLQSG